MSRRNWILAVAKEKLTRSVKTVFAQVSCHKNEMNIENALTDGPGLG